MADFEIFEFVIKNLGPFGGAAGVVGGLVTWLGKISNDKVLTNLNNENKRKLEELKTKNNKILEEHKKELELKNARIGILFEHRRESFKLIIDSMNNIFDQHKYDPIMEHIAWLYKQPLKNLKKIIDREQIYLSNRSIQVIELFMSLMDEIQSSSEEDCSNREFGNKEQKMIRKNYALLEFIKTDFFNYLKKEIGIHIDEPVLIKSEMLGACIEVLEKYYSNVESDDNLFEHDDRAKMLKIAKSPKENIDTIIKQLRMIKDTGNEKFKNYWFIQRAEYYIKVLSQEKSL
jgi:hypothetical protein